MVAPRVEAFSTIVIKQSIRAVLFMPQKNYNDGQHRIGGVSAEWKA
jgi:hypothetical protein